MEQQSMMSGSSLPSDLTSEILLRLPAKSVGRFRCVSKLWLSITTDPFFIKSFGTTRPNFLLCSMKRYNLFMASTTHQSLIRSYSSSQPIHRYPKKFPGKDCYLSNLDSVYDLIYIEDLDSEKPIVWNPCTKQLLVLPKPNMSSTYVNVFLGYDPVEGKHKVVCLPHKETCYVSLVFTLGSGQESWRTIKTNLEHMCYGPAYGQCIINGVIYYLSDNKKWYEPVIMSFDVRCEIFRMIELPSDIHHYVLISYKGRLACIDRKKSTRLWILEDADEHKWSFQDFLLPLYNWVLNVSSEEHNWTASWNASYERNLNNLFQLKGCTYAGEFIYVPYKFHRSSYIIFYDPVKNSCRRLKFEGTVDKEFGYTMHVYPNHIESLMSM